MATILVVDDTDVNRELLAYLLSRSGHSVVAAPSAAEGYAAARRTRPDLAIIDLVLPEGDGEGLARRIRGDEALAGIPLVAVSVAVDRAGGALLAGFDTFFPMPIDPPALVELVEGFLAAGCPR